MTHENVKFTVYKPRVVAPLEWVPLLAFAHLEDLAEETGRKPEESIEEEIREQATPGDGPQPRSTRSTSRCLGRRSRR